MIHLYYANHLEALIAPLADQLSAGDPFETQTLVVPNRNLQQWLNLNLCERQGIAINLNFERLDPLLVQLIAGDEAVPLTDWTLQSMTMRRFGHHLEAQTAEMADLLGYLSGKGDPLMRQFQLSKRLVRLFREYAFSRESMIAAWDANRSWLGDDHPVERWQRRLWLELLGPEGAVAAHNADPERPVLTPLFRLNIDPAAPPRFKPLHLFGISYVSRFHQRLLKQLAQYGELHLYVLNPCWEFWEDVRTHKEARYARNREHDTIPPEAWDHGELPAPETDNPFLQAWGKPGREYFRLINDLGDWDFAEHFVKPRADTLLAQMQRDILFRQPVTTQPEAFAGDTSLQVLACAGPRREAEAVAGHIWQQLLKQPDLDVKDIAVIVTDMNTYQAEIENAFQRLHGLPFNLVDGATGRAARLIDAVSLLLQLPRSRFEREHLFRLYQHPNFQARFPHADPHSWLKYASALNIYFGRDREDQRAQGVAYFEKDLYNWDQGFKRLLLGPYFHDRGERVFQKEGEAYAVYALGETEAEPARLFYTITQSLFEDTGKIAHAQLSAKDWARYFRLMLNTYLAPCPGEDRDFERIRRIASQLEELGEAFEDPATPLPYAMVQAFFEDELATLRPFYNQYLADGITVSSFMPMRPIPFKLVYVMGLNEGAFPAPQRKDTLDLRWARMPVTRGTNDAFREREIGDVTDQERDRYMFLETLISTRDTLVLSYVDRDEQTDDPVNPASVLAETMYQAERYRGSFSPIQHPLKSYSERYGFSPEAAPDALVQFDPFAERLARARRDRQRLLQRLGTPDLPPLEELGRQGLLSDRLVKRLGLASHLDEAETETEPRISITLNQIRNFLECPLQATAKRALGLREDEEDLLSQVHEPFQLDRLHRHKILTQVIGDLLREHEGGFGANTTYQNLLDEAIYRYELKGHFPGGVLRPLNVAFLHQALDQWCQQLGRLDLQGHAGRYQFGTGNEETPPEYQTPPLELELELDGRKHILEITGTTQFIFQGEDGLRSIYFSSTDSKGPSSSRKKTQWGHHLLKSWLDAVALAAADRTETLQAAMIKPHPAAPDWQHFQLRREEARDYLVALVRDMLKPQHDYLAPGDIILDLAEKAADSEFEALFAQRVEKAKNDERGAIISRYGPLQEWADFPPAKDIRALIARRFGPLFRNLGHDIERRECAAEDTP